MTVRALVTGGARSGKSAFAERLARDLGGESVLYIATAEAPWTDCELRRRVEEHRRRRPAGWRTFEVLYARGEPPLSAALPAAGPEAVILDSLTLWVSGRMSAGAGDEEVLDELDGFLASAVGLPAPVVIVTDEVGLGLVPESLEGRRFRDLLGLANQRSAAAAREAYLCVAGVPLRVK